MYSPVRSSIPQYEEKKRLREAKFLATLSVGHWLSLRKNVDDTDLERI